MFETGSNDLGQCEGKEAIQPKEKSLNDLGVQLVLSLILGCSALVTFCILRPRWPSLYAARKNRLNPEVALPDLSNSFFGWIPQLWKISEEQILASAGLDAFVFLTFFKMAIRIFAIMAFFAITVLLPINNQYRHFDFGLGKDPPSKDASTSYYASPFYTPLDDGLDVFKGKPNKDRSWDRDHGWLWSYTIFTYLFVGLTIYFLNLETFRVIRYRQDYLGTQSTVTDRTFRLTGIPSDLRSEEQVKNLIEGLEIGQVDSVTICRNWGEIDSLVEQRDTVLRKLEASWSKLRQAQRTQRKDNAPRRRSTGEEDEATGDEEAGNGRLMEDNHDSDVERPQVKLRQGLFGFRTRKVDAIDYYEQRLRTLDDKIGESRKKSFPATDMALVTMDTVASCQMVTQARIDPRPGSLLTKPTPAPSDLVWKNTYAPRGIRRLKSWAVTVFITFLTLLWIFPTAFLATLLSICTIRNALPGFAEWLSEHPIINSLLQNGVPTLVVSLLNVAVPYLYDWLANHQGMISQGDVELSVISKNFFFIFFNTFFVFATSSTGFEFWSTMRKFIRDTSQIPAVIAAGVENLSTFYTSFIILQGIGLMPFRILEAGTIFLYPIYRFFASTPRDYAELENPPIFQYGFYLPTALLVFNLCLIYSVVNWGCAALVAGTIYFALGYSTFKYMVLYAMDQPQHATGGAWRIICYRMLTGVVVFEIFMIAKIATLAAFVQAIVILPLVPLTIWYSYYFKRRFEPLTKYIALRAIGKDGDSEDTAALDDAFRDEAEPRPSQGLLRRGSTLDEHREKGLVFVNPSMTMPLPQPWIYDEPPPAIPTEETQDDDEGPRLILPNADSSLGIGDDNVWSNDGGRS